MRLLEEGARKLQDKKNYLNERQPRKTWRITELHSTNHNEIPQKRVSADSKIDHFHFDTFAPVARITSIPYGYELALAAILNILLN
jgi:hypothetical protein